MALKPLKAVLRLDTTRANRNARKLKGEIRGVDGELKRADASSRGAAGGMGAWSVAGIAAAGAIVAAVGRITAALNEAIRLQNELAGNAFNVQRQVAGAATQFGLSPSQTVSLLAPIAQRAAVGAQGFGGLSSTATAAASAGLIEDPVIGPGGVPQFPGQGGAILGTLQTFIERIGEPGVGGPLPRLVSRGLEGAAPTQAGVRAALGDIQGAFLGSESANLGNFIQGALIGTAGLSAQGVGQQRLLSTFAAVVRQKATPRQAGELLRITGEKFFTGADPAIVEAIGRDRFFDLQESDPDKLFGEVFNLLLGSKGAERAELFKGLGISAEVSGRLADLAATSGGVTAIRERMAATTGGVIARQGQTFLESGGAVARAADTGIAGRQSRFGEGRRGETFAARQIAEAERRELGAENPLALEVLEIINLGTEREQEALLRGLLRRRAISEGLDPTRLGFRATEVDITPEGVEFFGGAQGTRDAFRRILGELMQGAKQVIINNPPAGRAGGAKSKADK